MLDLWRTNLHCDMFFSLRLVSFYSRQYKSMNVPYSCNLLSDAPLGPCNRRGGWCGIIPHSLVQDPWLRSVTLTVRHGSYRDKTESKNSCHV